MQNTFLTKFYILNILNNKTMQIHFTTSLNQNNLSFEAMKKNQFKGADRLCVEKFKAPIEKFNSNEDLQNWAGKFLQEINEHDYKGRSSGTCEERVILKQAWYNYLKNIEKCSNTLSLIVMHAFTKDLGVFDDNLPPILNKTIFADILNNLKKGIDTNINKNYQNSLFKFFYGDNLSEEKETKWIEIPSKIKDPDNFEANIAKLQTLSHNNWCTRNVYAKKYLQDGDFHILMNKNSAIIGVRFLGDRVEQIQAAENNGEIPLKYFEEVINHLKRYKKLDYAKEEINETQKVYKYLQKYRKDLKKAIEKKDYLSIFDYFGMLPDETHKELMWKKLNPLNILKKNNDNINKNIVLKYYSLPKISDPKMPLINKTCISFSDIGIDENEMFKSVDMIEGDADFTHSALTSLWNLEIINGDANFTFSSIKDLGKLEHIGGDVNFEYSKISDLKNLKYIGGYILSDNSELDVAKIMKFCADNHLN